VAEIKNASNSIVRLQGVSNRRDVFTITFRGIDKKVTSPGCLMMEAVRTSETSVDNYFTRQYIPEDNSDHHTRRRENLKSHIITNMATL
jgi:hypothetical protein